MNRRACSITLQKNVHCQHTSKFRMKNSKHTSLLLLIASRCVRHRIASMCVALIIVHTEKCSSSARTRRGTICVYMYARVGGTLPSKRVDKFERNANKARRRERRSSRGTGGAVARAIIRALPVSNLRESVCRQRVRTCQAVQQHHNRLLFHFVT